MQKHAPKFDFKVFLLIAVKTSDQKQPGFPEDVLPQYLSDLGVDYHILEQDLFCSQQEKKYRRQPSAALFATIVAVAL